MRTSICLLPYLGFPLNPGFGAAICCLILVSGCREQAAVVAPDSPSKLATTVELSDATLSARTAQPGTTSVLPDPSATEISPAVIDEQDPRAVCQRFLESLQSGNRIAAENLLTHTALNVTGKAGLVLEPLSGPNSRIEVGEAQYATIMNEVAYVSCQILDLDVPDEAPFEVTWIVKKQAENWRISGLLMELESGQPHKMFSFENLNDVAEIKLRAAEELVPSDQVPETSRQAKLPNTDADSNETIK